MADHLFDYCVGGDLYNAKRVVVDDDFNADRTFVITCATGHKRVAKWLLNEYPDVNHKKAFMVSCAHGKLRIAKWLFKIHPDMDINEDQFADICGRGHLDVVKWLFKTRPEINCAGNKIAFERCVAGRHIELAQWMYKKHKVDIHNDGEHVLGIACKNNDMDMAFWLLKTGLENEWFDHGIIFETGCKHGCIDIVEWLLKVRPDINIHERNEAAFVGCCKKIWTSNIDFFSFMVNQEKYIHVAELLIKLTQYDHTRYILTKGCAYIINPVEPIKNYHEININGCMIYYNYDPDVPMLQHYMDNIKTAKSARS